jgi:hypothetical protein
MARELVDQPKLAAAAARVQATPRETIMEAARQAPTHILQGLGKVSGLLAPRLGRHPRKS